jgi:hypothetical protein
MAPATATAMATAFVELSEMIKWTRANSVLQGGVSVLLFF